MIGLLACAMLLSPAAALRVTHGKDRSVGLPADYLEGAWLSISVSRSGSFFAQGDEVLEVKDGSVKAEGEDEAFGTISTFEGTTSTPQLKTDLDVWALTGAETDEDQCTKWNEFFKLVDGIKKKKAPSSAYALSQMDDSKEDTIVCVDWLHVGESSSPPLGMYSLAETSGERTMHWLRKPSEDDTIQALIMDLTAEVVGLSPYRSTLEEQIDWAGKQIDAILATPEDQVIRAVRRLINTSQHDLGMSEQLKVVLEEKIVKLVRVLRETFPGETLNPQSTQEAPF